MSPPPKLNYNFGAAQDLSQALAQLHDKILWLKWVRDTNRASCLDSRPGTWQGAKYRDFVAEFDPQQRALQELADRALRLKTQVDHATDEATRAARNLRDSGAR